MIKRFFVRRYRDDAIANSVPEIKREHAASVDFLFGTIKWLRNNIITCACDETVRTWLIGDVDKALSWWPVVFSDDEVPVKLRRRILTSVRRQRSRRVAAGKQNATRRSPDRHQ